MAATAARPPVPTYVLDRIVFVGPHIPNPKPGEEWWEVPCASKKAYGCEENMQRAVEGLKLYARLGDGPLLTSSLAIHMGVDERRIFESEVGIDPDGPMGSDLSASAQVVMAEEQGVTAIVLSLRRLSLPFLSQRRLCYYLVYDSTDRSLSMFQIGRGVCTLKTIVPKRADRSDYDRLFLLGRKVRSSSDRDVFWVGSLSSSDNDGTAAAVPSKFKSMDFPKGEIHRAFRVDVAFSFQGKGFWGDLEHGLLFCDLQAGADDPDDMDFGFVELPSECKVDLETYYDDEHPLPMRYTRTMGCAGDSIWFVWIDMSSHYANAVVCIWELDLPLPGEQLIKGEWKMVDKVPVKVLWELSSFKESGLPAAPFRYPILTADGALCFVLVDQSRFPRNECPLVDHFCCFDMRYKRLLWHGLVHNYSMTDSIIMHPSSSFLRMKQCPCDMSFAEDHPAAGLKAMAGGEDGPAAGLQAMAGGEDSPAAGLEAMAGGVREVILLFESMAGGVCERVK